MARHQSRYIAIGKAPAATPAPAGGFHSKTYYGMDSICDGLRELERMMNADPAVTVWALPGILERTEEHDE